MSQRHLGVTRGKANHPPRVRHQNGSARVAVFRIDLLDYHNLGPPLGKDFINRLVDATEPRRKVAAAGANHPRLDQRLAAAVDINYPVAAGSQPGVYAQHAHAAAPPRLASKTLAARACIIAARANSVKRGSHGNSRPSWIAAR